MNDRRARAHFSKEDFVPHHRGPRVGPFHVLFSDVLLEGDTRPIQLTRKQAALLRVLWELEGRRIDGKLLMIMARCRSGKPVLLFKKRRYPQAHRAYLALVRSNVYGEYWLPRSADEDARESPA